MIELNLKTGYNNSIAEDSWGVRHSCYFEPTFIESGYLDSCMDARPPFAVEGRDMCAVTHLALARSQNTGNGILGILITE